MLVDPGLVLLVPPRLLVAQGHAKPTFKRLLDPPVARTAVGPAEEMDQGVAAEEYRSRSVKPLLALVSWMRPTMTSSSMAVGSPYRSAAVIVSRLVMDSPLLWSLDPVLEDEGLDLGGDAAGESRQGELGKVQLVRAPLLWSTWAVGCSGGGGLGGTGLNSLDFSP